MEQELDSIVPTVPVVLNKPHDAAVQRSESFDRGGWGAYLSVAEMVPPSAAWASGSATTSAAHADYTCTPATTGSAVTGTGHA